MLRRYVSVIVRWPKTVIAIVALISLFLGFNMRKIRILLDIDDQIPPNHPMVVVGKRIERFFGGKYLTVVGVYPESGTVYTPKILGKIKRITEGLEKVPGVKPGSVMSLMSSRVKDIRSTEEALEIKPLSDKVPETEAELKAFREKVERNKLVTSLLVSDDGRAAAIMVDFADFEKAGGALGCYDRLEAVFEPEREPGVEIRGAGVTIVSHWLLVYTRRVAGLFVLAVAMVGYLHYRAFRTLQGMIIPLVTALMGVVWALGLMGLIGAPLDPWNSMTPILILAIGAGHSVQILKRYYEEFGRLQAARPDASPVEHNRDAVIEATTKVGLVMLAAGTIASLSFLSLITFKLPSIRNFGLCTAFGILAALTVEMTFIPAVRVLMTPPSKHQTDREKGEEYFDPILEKLAKIVRDGRERPAVWVFLAVIAIAGVGLLRLDARNNLAAQFFEANAPIRGFRLADERLNGTRVIQVLIEGGAPDTIKDPEVLKRMDELTTFMTRQPLAVGRVVSVLDVLKTLNQVILNEPEAKNLPDTRQAVAQFLLLYSMSGDNDDLTRLVDPDFQRAVLTAYIKTDDNPQMKAFAVAVEKEAERLFQGMPVKASVGGGVTNTIALNETMVRGKIMNLLQISFLVLVISSILLRSFVGGLIVLLPLGTSALVNLGLMGWTGIVLSLSTAAISAMAVGIGADYAVYFLFRVREEFHRVGDLRQATSIALTTSGKAIAYVASAVAGGYLCLALSFFKTHVLLGILVALTMVTCSAATVVFLPAVTLMVKPRFLTRRVEPTGTVPTPTPVVEG